MPEPLHSLQEGRALLPPPTAAPHPSPPHHPKSLGVVPCLHPRTDAQAVPTEPLIHAHDVAAAPPTSVDAAGHADGEERRSPAAPSVCPDLPGVLRSAYNFNRVRGMRCLPPTPTTSLVHATSAATSLSSAAPPHDACGATPLHVTSLPPPRPPAHTSSLPAVYRPAASQFIKAIRRLNAMTSATCAARDTTSLEFVSTAPTQQQGRERVRTVSHVSSVRRLASVSPLPLTICTDGSTVVLVDRNGTARHRNYVQAVSMYLRGRREAMGNVTRVLWWTLEDLQVGAGGGGGRTVALSSARAMQTQQTAPVTGFAQQAPLRSIRLDKLSLPFGEGLVVVFTAMQADLASSSSASIEQGHVVKQSSPSITTSAATTSSGALVQDVCHGYLPSLLEDVYPSGGVQLCGCWCVAPTPPLPLPNSVCSADTSYQPALPDGDELPFDGWKKDVHEDDGVAVVRVATPLVYLHDVSAGESSPQQRSSQAAAAAAERVMRSLRPSSQLPPRQHQQQPPVRLRESSPSSSHPPFSDYVLELPPKVMRFVLQSTAQGAECRDALTANSTLAAQERRPFAAAVPLEDETAAATRGEVRGTRVVPPATQLSSTISFACPLLRGDDGGSGGVVPARATSAPSPKRTPAAVTSPSVLVLTPMGRVEFVAPEICVGSTASCTVGDVKRSLLRSAVGRSLHLREASVELVYGPGTPALRESDVIAGTRVVLRLRRSKLREPHTEDEQ